MHHPPANPIAGPRVKAIFSPDWTRAAEHGKASHVGVHDGDKVG